MYFCYIEILGHGVFKFGQTPNWGGGGLKFGQLKECWMDTVLVN